MAVELKDVKHWVLDRGIGHILLSARRGWNFTACGMAGPSMLETKKRPGRVCSKCRALLPTIKPSAQ